MNIFQEESTTAYETMQTTMSYNGLLNETGRAGERMFSGTKLTTHCYLR